MVKEKRNGKRRYVRWWKTEKGEEKKDKGKGKQEEKEIGRKRKEEKRDS
jgi:hypothetical protein